MSGVTHSRALGEEEAAPFTIRERPRRAGKSFVVALAEIERQRAILRRAIMLEKRGSKKRMKYEAQMAELTKQALRLSLGRRS